MKNPMNPSFHAPAFRSRHMSSVLARLAVAIGLLCQGGFPFGIYLSNTQVPIAQVAQRLDFILSNTFVVGNVTNAGVNKITIQKPAILAWNAGPIATNVQVRTYYDGVTLSNLSASNWHSNWSFVNDAFMVQTNGDDLVIVLGNAVTNNALDARNHVWVSLTVMPSNAFQTASFTALSESALFNGMAAVKKSNYSTGGRELSVNAAVLSATLSPADGFASIIPNTVNQGTSPYTFTFYIQNQTNSGYNDITRAAIRIPDAFSSPALFTNFDSILLGTNEAQYIRVTNAIPGFPGTNWITIDYSATPITRGGLDVISFKYTTDPALATNVAWETRVDGSFITNSSHLCATNANYPSQLLTVGVYSPNAPWDYLVTKSRSVSPTVIGVSNVYAMAYLDLVADVQDPATQKVTNFTFKMEGAGAGVDGWVRIYKTNSGSNFSTSAGLVASIPINPGQVLYDVAVNEINQSTAQLDPTRYWLTLYLTNDSAAAYTNKVRLSWTNLIVVGPNSGTISGTAFFQMPLEFSPARVDTLKVSVNAVMATNTTNFTKVRQGSFDNLAFRFTVSNSDPDATNFLSSFLVTNLGTADNNDLGAFKLFRDNGDGLFGAGDDAVVSAFMATNGRYYTCVSSVPIPLGGTNTVTFFGAYDVKYSATNGRTACLSMFLDDRLVWANGYKDIDFSTNLSDPRPTNQATAARLPAPNTTNFIIPSTAQAYDFLLSSVSYVGYPGTFTTNQLVPIGKFTLTMDTENTNGSEFTNLGTAAQVFRAVQGKTLTSNTAAAALGQAYLYRDANADGAWQASDTVLATNAVAGDGAFILSNLNLSNVAIESLAAAQTYFIVFKLTNSAAAAWTNTFGVQITNLLVSGPDGGVLANSNLLTNAFSSIARLDDGAVTIVSINNFFTPSKAIQTSVKNKYLEIVLKGNDPDAIFALSSIDVVTNSKCDLNLASDCIPQVAVENAVGDLLGLGKITNGSLRISFFTPEILTGTNATTNYITYNVAVFAPKDSNFGLAITNGSFGFADPYLADNFPQTAFVSGGSSGPAAVSNVVVAPLDYVPWDFNIIAAGTAAPVSLSVSNIYALSYADIRADTEAPALQKITNAWVKISGKAAEAQGWVLVYRDTNTFTTFSTNLDQLVGSNAFSGVGVANVGFSSVQFNLNTETNLPNYTRFWVAVRLTNAGTNGDPLWTNTIHAAFTNFGGDYATSQIKLTNAELLTNYVPSYSRVDSWRMALGSASNTASGVVQGSFNNLAFALWCTNSDPDGTNYLGKLVASNTGNVSNTRLGFFRVYVDNGDSNYDPAVDTLAGLGSGDSTNQWIVNLVPPVAMKPGATLLWGAYDLTLSAGVGEKVSFVIPAGTNAVVWADSIADNSFASYNKSARTASAGPYPAPSTWQSNTVNGFAELPWDFRIVSATPLAPAAMTTNQSVALWKFQILRDYASNDMVVTNARVAVSSGGSKANVTGLVSLVVDSNLSGAYDSNDLVLGTVPLIGGADVDIPVSWSNATQNLANPDLVFLVFRLTNSLASAMNDKVRMQVLSLSGIGKDGTNGGLGTFDAFISNQVAFTNAPPLADTRIDSYRVLVPWVSNAISTYTPRQYDQNNGYLHIRLAGEDPDAAYSLSGIDLSTNALSSSFVPDLVTLVKAGTGLLGASGKINNILGISSFTNGAVRISFSTPLALSGATPQDLYIGYDAGVSTNIYGRSMGLTISNAAAFVFGDATNDGVDQTGYADPAFAGGPATATNVTFYSYNSQPWDVELTGMALFAPQRAVTNVEIGLMGLDCYRDLENGAEALTAIHFSGVSTANRDYSGRVNVYYAYSSEGFTNASLGTRLVTNVALSSTNPGVTLALPTQPLAVLPGYSRFLVTFTPDRFDPSAQVLFKITNLTCTGPNGGLFSTPSFLYLTNKVSVAFDELSVTATVTNLASGGLKQGEGGFPLLKISLAAVDGDAPIHLERLTFTLSNSLGQDKFMSGRLYRESGAKEGFDTNDLALSGSVAFSENTAKIALDSPASLAGGLTLYLVASADAGATAGNAVRVTFPGGSQGTAFAAVQASGGSMLPLLAAFANEQTAEFTIVRAIDFGADTIKPATTIVKPCAGSLFRYYFKDASTAAKAKVRVHDAFGAWVRDLPIATDVAEWDGSKRDGSSAASGFYSVVVEVDKATVKRILVFLQRCR